MFRKTEVLMHVIDFEQTKKAFKRYDEAIAEAREIAAAAHERLVTAAINIATSGPWREWDAEIPEGTAMEFDPDSLIACGDPVVVQLIRAADALDEILSAAGSHP
jgi:hypothetical protein